MMQDELNGLQVKKKTLPGLIDVHPTDQALIVHYTVQASIYDERKTKIAQEDKEMSKTIRFKTLNSNTNLSQIAQDIIEKCSLISPSRIKEVEQSLYYLLQRNLKGKRGVSSPTKRSGERDPELELYDVEGEDQEEPSMALIDTYIEGLYDDMKDKVTATRKILELARVPENQEPLIRNESLISALCRVLREDGKRSMELATNIIYTFFCVSNFSEFHEFLTTNKLGDMCFKLMDHEKARYQILMSDMKQIGGSSTAELDQKKKRLETLLKRQDQLFFLTLHLLLNLAENLSIEVKIVKRGIIGTLVLMLDRPTLDLVALSITFLKKLSIFEENVEEMLQFGDELVANLVRLIPNDELSLQDLVLRLLTNLSHNIDFKSILVKSGLLPKLVVLYENGTLSDRVIPLLYQLSIDEKHRTLQAFADIIPTTMRTLLEHQDDHLPIDIMTLAINLATQPRNAHIIINDNGLKLLTRRSLKTRDPLLLRMLRVLAQHDESIKMQFLDFIDPIMSLILKGDTPSGILVEALGMIANLNIDKFDYGKLVKTYPILPFIHKNLYLFISQCPSGGSMLSQDDDVALELVRLLGTLCIDDEVIPAIANEHIPQLLTEFMVSKEEDDEIVLHALFCIHRLLFFDVTRTLLMQDTDIVSYLVDLLYDNNVEIRKLCDASLDIIAELEESWVAKIRQQKFQWHNSEWLQLISQEAHENNTTSETPGQYREDSLDAGSHRIQNSRDIIKRPIKHSQRKVNLEYEMESDDEQQFELRSNVLLDGPL